MPARSNLQEKKAREAVHERGWTLRLAAHKPGRVEVPDAAALTRDLARLYPGYVHRDPGSFNRSIRSKDPTKIRLLAAEHVFGRYPAGPHIRSIWCEDGADRAAPSADAARTLAFRRTVYLEAVSGGSVHKRCTGAFMTRQETHRFLGLTHTESFVAAVWFALARSYTDDVGLAKRVAVSQIAEQPFADPFWREVLRFFCVNPVPFAQMNDVVDFLRSERLANPEYSIRGRTVASLRGRVEQWHRALHRARRLGNATWPGVDLPDAVYCDEAHPRRGRLDWKFTQIKSSEDLADEGTAMRHCVSAYQPRCISGDASIWSLKVRPADRRDATPWNRALTIEMANAERRLVQLRGYANRPMKRDERPIVSKWSSENGLSVAHWA